MVDSYRLYNDVEVSMGYTGPSAAGTRLCIYTVETDSSSV